MIKTLDFAVIGGQKCGTTSLFEYLRKHPDIFIPPEKEVPYFSNDGRYGDGWSRFASQYYSRARREQLWGKVTPHYMVDGRVAARLKREMPEARLVAILRNPVERAQSQWKMAVRRQLDKRSFEDAVRELLEPAMVARARSMSISRSSATAGYLVWGEYGRQLRAFYDIFDARQVLVIFLEEFAQKPAPAFAQLLGFLGADPEFSPANLGRRYHAGGSRRRLPWLHHPVLRKAGKRLRLPAIKRLARWLGTRDAIEARYAGMSAETDSLLREFFERDVALLQTLVGRPVPWREFSGATGPESARDAAAVGRVTGGT